ncbi:thiamine phosphate synthase [Tessaracoccus sp. MC1756]|uniref:thiamine phosphate synthase n=1 Tax=Tessaracoccus sp. MC1756 TaxID=2760311 RepID=UPI0015FF2385|nr:thiamine phosphate synthase [Tessaracoccus sp. MC1756]MBB1509898.1 thiamine phosphate synthase [Tessaracoccus sp. MC1756]
MQAHKKLAKQVDWRLYVVTDTELAGGPDRVPRIVEQAVLGGAGVVQVRDKHMSEVEFLHLTQACVDATQRVFDATGHSAAIFVNDRLDIAADLGLHFHMGQSDGDITEARRRLGQDLMIGLSISNSGQLRTELRHQTADVLGLSPIWTTSTKTDTEPPLELQGAEQIVRETAGRAKTVAIGGINPVNAPWVIDTGVDGICVVSAIMTAPDPLAAAKELMSLWRTR